APLLQLRVQSPQPLFAFLESCLAFAQVVGHALREFQGPGARGGKRVHESEQEQVGGDASEQYRPGKIPVRCADEALVVADFEVPAHAGQIDRPIRDEARRITGCRTGISDRRAAPCPADRPRTAAYRCAPAGAGTSADSVLRAPGLP